LYQRVQIASAQIAGYKVISSVTDAFALPVSLSELFYTERAHVRNLKVMQQLFLLPMLENPSIASPEFVNLLFPNIDEMIRVHG
jgi:RhoGEF domain